MNKFKTIALLVALLVALTGAGCKGNAVQSLFKSQTTKKAAREVAEEATERVVGSAFGNRSDNNYQYSNNTSDNNTNPKNSGKSHVAKAGAVVAGAAAATAGSVAASEQSINNKVNRSSDDVLGGVKLGDLLSDTSQSLGNPIKKTNKGGNVYRYEYQSMEVAYDSGSVVGLVTDVENVRTPRGIHAGSSLTEVLNKYGKNYILSVYNNLDLYEYKFKKSDSKPYILRFAVNQGNQKVNYISIRYDE